MEIAVTSDVLEHLREAARRAHPHECCGILFGSARCLDTAVPAANIHTKPATHFEIDPQALIDAYRSQRQGGARIAGFYHSHPSGPARPSQTDMKSAAGDGSIWAIIGQDEISFWQDAKCGFEPLSYRLVDG